MSSATDVSDDDSCVDLYAVVEGRARPKRPSKHEATDEDKLPRRRNSRTPASIEICDFDPLAVEEMRRLEKNRVLESSELQPVDSMRYFAPSRRPSRRHSVSTPSVSKEPHKLFVGISPTLISPSEKVRAGEKSLHRPPPELVDTSHQRRRQSRRRSVGDVVDLGAVNRLRELGIDPSDDDDDDKASTQTSSVVMIIPQPQNNNNENSSRQQGIAHQEPQRSESTGNLNELAETGSSEQLHWEQRPQIKQPVAQSLVLASQRIGRQQSVGDIIDLGDINRCQDLISGNDDNDSNTDDVMSHDLTVQCGHGKRIARQQRTARQEPHQREQSVKHVDVVVENRPTKPEQDRARRTLLIEQLNSATMRQQSPRRLSLGDVADLASINGDATHVPSRPLPLQPVQLSKCSTANVQVQLRGEAAVVIGSARKIGPQYYSAAQNSRPQQQRIQLIGMSILEEASSSAKKTGGQEQDQGGGKARNKGRSPSPPSPRRTSRWGGSTRRRSHSVEMKAANKETKPQDKKLLSQKKHLNHLFGMM